MGYSTDAQGRMCRTDWDILEDVAAAMETAHEAGDNWVDHLPPEFGDSEDRYAGDHWYVGTLADGRTVWLAYEDRCGADRYSIRAAE